MAIPITEANATVCVSKHHFKDWSKNLCFKLLNRAAIPPQGAGKSLILGVHFLLGASWLPEECPPPKLGYRTQCSSNQEGKLYG